MAKSALAVADRAIGSADFLTAEDVVAAVSDVTAELQDYALAEEEAGKLSDRTVERLAETGAFDISIPRAYGGLAFDVADQRRVYSAVGKIAGSTGWVTWVTTTHVRWIAMMERKAQDEVYGMDWRGPRVSGVVKADGPGKATPVEGGYLLEGSWPFCSGSRHTAWSFLGAIVQNEDGAREHRLMLVPASDLEIVDDWKVSGMRASASNTVRLSKPTFVPEYRTIGSLAAVTGHWRSPPPEGLLYRNNFIIYTTLLSGATPLGMAQGALDYYMARLQRRGITGTGYKVQAEAPVTHLQLADAKWRIDAAQRVLDEDASEIDQRAADGRSHDPVFNSKVKFDVAVAVRSCAEAVEILQRGAGAATIHQANPMQRYARDIRVATVHAQFNYETCAEEYGGLLCGKPPYNLLADI